MNNCPLGKLSCDGCSMFTTGGCLKKQESQSFSITREDMIALWERKREELMKRSKEDLIELLIGKKEHIGITFG